MDTICALATAAGNAGIAIIRISGPESKKILEKIFLSKYELKPRKMVFGRLKLNETEDSILAVYFPAPNSFTGEDVCEIHCHGGYFPTKAALETVINAGARPAEAGEFTKRAFLNGKIDLSSAEAVMDYIGAVSEAGAKIAANQLKGALKQKIENYQDRLTDVIAELEAGIEYPEEDLEEDIKNKTVPQLKSILADTDALINTFNWGRQLKEGIKIAICGRPNVGKSSLLNAIIGEQKAIVTHIPGTTRDVITETYNIKSIPVVFMDTAGIHETADIVEKIGVERSKKAIEESDITLVVLDVSQELQQEDKEILSAIYSEKTIFVLNKCDNGIKLDIDGIKTSAKLGEGIDELLEKIYEKAVLNRSLSEGLAINNERHLYALKKAETALTEAINAFEFGIDLDCISIDIKTAWNAFGEITGRTVSEDIVDRIFEKFCLGK